MVMEERNASTVIIILSVIISFISRICRMVIMTYLTRTSSFRGFMSTCISMMLSSYLPSLRVSVTTTTSASGMNSANPLTLLYRVQFVHSQGIMFQAVITDENYKNTSHRTLAIVDACTGLIELLVKISNNICNKLIET